MFLTETAPAALNAVPLREFAAHLRLAEGFAEDGCEDALLELYLRNATAAIERRLGQALIRRPFVLRVSCWDRNGHLVLPVGPVAAIDSLAFTRGGGSTPVDIAMLEVEPGSSRQRLTGSMGMALPPVPPGHVAELGFTAGHGDSWNAVPDDLRQAVMLLAGAYFESRYSDEGAASVLPAGVAALIEPHRPVRL